MELGFSKRYSVETLRNACCVVSYLARAGFGVDGATIRAQCGFTPKQTENVLKALTICGAVLRRAELPPVAKRGARSRFVYFLAASPTRFDGDAEGFGADAEGGADGEEFAGDEGEGTPPEEGAEGGGELAVDYPPEKIGNGEIIADETGEIIGAPFSININTQEIEINKRARGKRVLKKNSNSNKARVEDSKKAPIEALVGSVRLDSYEAQDFRRRLKSVAWDRGANVGLFDRAVAAVLLGFASPAEMLGLAKDAVREATRDGVENWRRFTLKVKALFDKVAVWTATDFQKEPAPEAWWNRIVSLRLNDAGEDEFDGARVRRVDGRNVVVFGAA